MTPAAHDEISALLGPAALGVLSAADSARLEQHLSACQVCRAELDSLVAVAQGLTLLTPEEAQNDGLAPSPVFATGLGDAVLARVAGSRRDERRRATRWQAGFAGTAAVAVLASGVVTAAALQRSDPAGPTVEAVSVSAAAGVQASAGLVAHTWGVEITLRATGFAQGQAYRVEVVGRDGRTRSAGAFVGTGTRTMTCNLNSSVLRADAASFAVLDELGATVLSATL